MLEDLRALSAALELYIEGFHESDAGKLASVFHPQARLLVIQEGELQPTAIADYLAIIEKRNPIAKNDRKKTIHSLSLCGESVAVARVSVTNSKSIFEDALTFVRDTKGWRIAVKTYHATDLQPKVAS